MSLLTPTRLFKCLSDDTRLVLMLLVHAEGELCVCEMTYVLQESQPKVSRHLAQLRNCSLLLDRRQGQWVYYRLMPDLPSWVLPVLVAAAEGSKHRMAPLLARLATMDGRPNREC